MRRPVSVPQILVLLAALAAPATVLHAQGGAAPAAGAPSAGGPAGAPQAGGPGEVPPAGRARGPGGPNLTATEPMGPVENVTAYPVPPEGFNVERENIPHGEVKLVE